MKNKENFQEIKKEEVKEKAHNIEIKHNEYRPLTISEAYNKLEDDEKNADKILQEEMKGIKISVALDSDKLKYLFYCINFLDNKKEINWLKNFILICNYYKKTGKTKEQAYRDIAINMFKNPIEVNIGKVKTIEKRIFNKLMNKIDNLNASKISLIN